MAANYRRPARSRRMRSWSELAAKGPRRRRAIIALGLLLCVALAVAGAYLLGLFDRLGLLG